MLNLSPTSPIVCFTGSLFPYQGVDLLIRAAPAILARDPAILFLIVGDGPRLRESMDLVKESEVAGSFHFTGRVPYQKVPLYINAADLCVAPKKPILSGYSPLKLYEYMACGKPVIADENGGFRDPEGPTSGDPHRPRRFPRIRKCDNDAHGE